MFFCLAAVVDLNVAKGQKVEDDQDDDEQGQNSGSNGKSHHSILAGGVVGLGVLAVGWVDDAATGSRAYTLSRSIPVAVWTTGDGVAVFSSK